MIQKLIQKHNAFFENCLANYSFAGRLITGLSILLVLFGLIGFYAQVTVGTLWDKTDKHYHNSLSIILANESIRTDITSLHLSLRRSSLTTGGPQIDQATSTLINFETQTAEQYNIIQKYFSGDKSIMEDVRISLLEWVAVRKDLIQYIKAGNISAAEELLVVDSPARMIVLKNNTARLHEYILNYSEQLERENLAQHQRSRLITQSLLFIALTLGFIIAYFIISTSVLPMKSLERAMVLIAGGNIEVDIPHLKRVGEIGNLARALQIFKEGVFERIRLEEERLSAEKTLEDVNIQKNVLDEHSIVAITNRAGIITYVNDKFCEISKYSRSEIIGRSHNLVNSGHHSREFFAGMWQTISSGSIWRGEVKNRAKDGSYYWVMSTIMPLMDDQGKIRQYIAMRTDITQLMNAKRHLADAQKMRFVGHLSSGISHDFNNLLSIISGNITYLEDMVHDQPDVTEVFDDIKHAVLRGANLSKKLMSLGYKPEKDLQVYNINSEIEKLRAVLEKYIKQDATLEFCLDDDLWNTRTNIFEFEDVLINLVMNAHAAMTEPGIIRITTRNHVQDQYSVMTLTDLQPGKYILFSITDEGAGIPSDIMPKIFEPFFSTKLGKQGVGLGLSMVYRFILQAGGAINVTSIVDQGTTFDLYFPYTDTGPTSFVPTVLPDQPAKIRANILVVDDEPGIIKVCRRFLEAMDATVFEANNVSEAISLLATHKIDLVLSDIEMPGKRNGLDLALFIENQKPEIKIILMSGHSERLLEFNQKYHDLKEGVIQKPFQPDVVIEKIKDTLSL